jgi:hypothetical protein
MHAYRFAVATAARAPPPPPPAPPPPRARARAPPRAAAAAAARRHRELICMHSGMVKRNRFPGPRPLHILIQALPGQTDNESYN